MSLMTVRPCLPLVCAVLGFAAVEGIVVAAVVVTPTLGNAVGLLVLAEAQAESSAMPGNA
jgi:hypothetical protein